MAESTATLKYSTLRTAIGYYLGFGRTSGNWTASETADIDYVLDRGLAQAYYPPPLPGERVAHEWSFLKPESTFKVWGTYTYTASGDPDGGTNLTATAGSTDFLTGTTMVGKTVTFTTSGNTYTVASVTSATVLVTTGSMSGETSGDTFKVTSDGNFNLPDNHGGFSGDGRLHYGTDDNSWYSIELTSPSRIMSCRQQNISDSRPILAAERPTASGSSTQSTRSELMIWPTPTSTYTLHYRALILQDALTSDVYPLGGPAHSELMLASCLAVAESHIGDTQGNHAANFTRLLSASVSRDRLAFDTKKYGVNTDRSDGYSPHRRFYDEVTYQGSEYFGS
jgi:hypothetical protein